MFHNTPASTQHYGHSKDILLLKSLPQVSNGLLELTVAELLVSVIYVKKKRFIVHTLFRNDSSENNIIINIG